MGGQHFFEHAGGGGKDIFMLSKGGGGHILNVNFSAALRARIIDYRRNECNNNIQDKHTLVHCPFGYAQIIHVSQGSPNLSLFPAGLYEVGR